MAVTYRQWHSGEHPNLIFRVGSVSLCTSGFTVYFDFLPQSNNMAVGLIGLSKVSSGERERMCMFVCLVYFCVGLYRTGPLLNIHLEIGTSPPVIPQG